MSESQESVSSNNIGVEHRPTAGEQRIWWFFWAIVVVVFILDQSAKALALQSEWDHNPVTVIPSFFELWLTFNRGAAFSLFPEGRWVFVAVSVGAFIFIPCYLRMLLRSGTAHPLYPLGFGLMLGGALGNAYDRILREHGEVVDFLHFYWLQPGPGRSFPVFNLADSAITIGLSAILLVVLFPGLVGGRGVRAETDHVAGSI